MKRSPPDVPWRVTSPAPRDAWLEVLESDPAAFLYQTPTGLDALCAQQDGEDASRLYEFPDGRRLVLPLYRRRGRPAWLSVERSPRVGSLVSPGSPRPEELRAMFADLETRPVLRVMVRPTALTGDAWAAAAPKTAFRVPFLSHVLDLQGGFATVWEQRFNRQCRRAVRKAERAGLDVECDSTGSLVPVFYDLLQLSVERWARQRREPRFLARWRSRRGQPLRSFQLLAGRLGDSCRIWVARAGGRPAAAILVLQGSNAHYTAGAMDRDLASPLRANFLLHRLAIEDACRSGSRYYNMGETGASDSLARFKAHFGAQAYPHEEYRFERLPITVVEQRLRGAARRLIRLGRGTSPAAAGGDRGPAQAGTADRG